MNLPLSLKNSETFRLNTPMLLQENGQLPLLSYQLFQPYHTRVTNVISTRLGGVSAPPYHELNLALSTLDDRDAVLENRQRLCRAVGVELEALTVGQLIQGTHIAVVSEDIRGRGSLDRAAALQGTDGLVTNLPNTPLVVLVADCTVCSYFDPVRQVVALAHAGWRGTAGGIAKKMVEMMHEVFGCDSRDILVGIGPNIGAKNFQVRDDVLQAFRVSYGDQAKDFFAPQEDGSYLLDLNAALVRQLKDSGIREEHMEIAGICTYERTDLFYSHRAEHGRTGRFAGLIVLHP
jgi:YfiH family protein